MGEGGGHAAGGAGAAEADHPAAGGEAELGVGSVTGGLGVETGGQDEEGEARGGGERVLAALVPDAECLAPRPQSNLNTPLRYP